MSAPSTATQEAQTSSQPVLLYVQGADQRTIALERLPFTIGRKTDRDLVIADSRVSREHAMIIAENGEYYVVDQSSRHGTFVNGTKRDRQRLAPNDRLDFGARDASYCIFNPERARTSGAAEFLSQISMMSVPAGGSELEKLRIFLEAARRLSTHGVLDDVLVTLLDSTLRLTKAERGFVFLKDAEGKLRLAAGRNARGDVLRDDSAISHSILEEAASAASEFVVSDTSKSSDLAGRQSIIAYDLRTVIALPLRKTQMGKGVTTDTAEIHLQQEKQADVRGVLYLDSRFASRDLPGVSHDILRAIATEAAALVENARLVAAEEEAKRYQQELSIAASIQQRLMSVDFPDVPYASVQATNLACKDVGGDFFDVVLTDRGLALIVADVSGKGISAALLASILQGLIYSQLLADVPLADIVTAANRFLCQRVAGQKYATLIVALLSPNGELEYVNCGHVPPVLTSSGQVNRPRECNLPIGLLPSGEYESARLKLSPGGRLLLLTDGVTEAEDASGEFYGDKRLEEAAANSAPYDAIFNSVRAFCGDTPLSDDCTVVELLYKG